MHKIVFFDVDGTLTDHRDGTIPVNTQHTVRALINRGIHVVAATGRPLSMCNQLISLGIQTFITANGAYVKHKETVIHKNVLDSNVLRDVHDYAKYHDSGLLFFTEGLSMNGVKNDRIQTALYETLLLNDYPEHDPLIHEKDVYLMCLYEDQAGSKHFEERFPELTFSRWHSSICNVLQEDVDKSIAIKNVLSYFGIKASEAIAFGDGSNDIEMIKTVGTGIAMGNGNDQLKSIADFVTTSSTEDGITLALQKYGILPV
ncbi:Cof-type HAD-IIB family hydrolase [Alkalihalobacillus sp. FSL R5-0424]